jgi:CRISPR-associated protein Csc2
MSKRKAVAPERRTGREILRKLAKLNKDDKGNICSINKTMCGMCIDCLIYGSAVGNNISNKSHVVSDEAFSILDYDTVTDEHTFNALFENGTMISDGGDNSRSINTDEVVRPGAVFLDMETFTDITMDAFTYIFGNILRTRRYGAMSSRLGKMTNIVVGIVFSNCELFSNLEWVQETYDVLCHESNIPIDGKPSFPTDPNLAVKCSKISLKTLLQGINGSTVILGDDEIAEVVNQVSEIYKDDSKIDSVLKRIIPPTPPTSDKVEMKPLKKKEDNPVKKPAALV